MSTLVAYPVCPTCSRCGLKQGILWWILPEIRVCKMMAVLLEGAERTTSMVRSRTGKPDKHWVPPRHLGTPGGCEVSHFRSYSQGPCENTPHTNPVTHNFFMSTGMLCEQNNVFLTLTFQADNLQLWPVFLTLLSEWGWAVGLSYWRSGDLGCSFCGFHLFQLWVCCIQGLIPGQICVCSSLWILFLECFRRFQLMFHCLASVPLSFLSLLPLVLLFPRALNADFYAVGLCYAFNTWSYFL